MSKILDETDTKNLKGINKVQFFLKKISGKYICCINCMCAKIIILKH